MRSRHFPGAYSSSHPQSMFTMNTVVSLPSPMTRTWPRSKPTTVTSSPSLHLGGLSHAPDAEHGFVGLLRVNLLHARADAGGKLHFGRQCDGHEFMETRPRLFQLLLVKATSSPCRQFQNALARFGSSEESFSATMWEEIPTL
jgi:hypothetical protein